MNSDNLLENDGNIYSIPMWDELRRVYDAKWEEEKDKFHDQLKENFRALVGQYSCSGEAGSLDLATIVDSNLTACPQLLPG